MPRKIEEVYRELYERFEDESVITVELQEEAHAHGISIEAVESMALASREDDDDGEE